MYNYKDVKGGGARCMVQGVGMRYLFFIVTCHLSVAASSYVFTSGPFTILYDDTQTPTLRVNRGSRTVWYTSAGNATFVTAARVDESVEQNGGTFIFKTAVQEVCMDMQITRNGSRRSPNGSDYRQVNYG